MSKHSNPLGVAIVAAFTILVVVVSIIAILSD